MSSVRLNVLMSNLLIKIQRAINFMSYMNTSIETKLKIHIKEGKV